MNYGEKIAREVVETIIESIENGIDGSWSAPWTKLGTDLPRNAFSGRFYTGINPFILAMAAFQNGYASPYWATFNQWKNAGYKIKKGTKTEAIAFWMPNTYTKKSESGEEEIKNGLIFKVYRVINSDCVEGWQAPTPKPDAFEPLEACETTVSALNVDLRHGGDRAFFVPSMNFIQMPERQQFHTAEGYYATLFHELVHWTGHPSRLNREFGKRFGDNAYAFEELVAELGAAMLCAMHGIEAVTRSSHAKYVKSWIDVLKANPKSLWTAGSKAQAAINYIMGDQAASNNQSETDERAAA